MSLTNGISIGIDVSKEKLDIYLLETNRYEVIKNEAKAMRKFFKQIAIKNEIKQVVLEATGGHERCCVKLLNELGIAVHVAHPSQVYHFARSKRLLAKTDKLDAKILALFGAQEEIKPTPQKSVEVEEMQGLVRRKQQLIDLLTQEKLRLASPLSRGEISRSLKRTIKQLEQEIKLIDSKLDDCIERCEKLKEKVSRLKTFKGIGHASAVLLAIGMPELGEVSRTEIAQLFGLAPVNNDSGKKNGYRSIKGGRFHLRKGLYMAALAAIRHNPKMKAFYERLKAKGKKSKVAITAVMRKIVVILNALLRDSKDWELCSNSL